MASHRIGAYRITGVAKSDGSDKVIVVESLSKANAIAKAEIQGILVTDARLVKKKGRPVEPLGVQDPETASGTSSPAVSKSSPNYRPKSLYLANGLRTGAVVLLPIQCLVIMSVNSKSFEVPRDFNISNGYIDTRDVITIVGYNLFGIAACVLSLFCFVISSRRIGATTLIMSGLSVIVLSATFLNVYRTMPATSQLNQLNQANDLAMASRTIDQVLAAGEQSRHDPRAAADTIDRVRQSAFKELDESAHDLVGVERIIADTINRVGLRFTDSASDEARALIRFGEAGGIDPSTLSTAMAFNYRRKLLEEVFRLMRQRDQAISKVGDELREDLLNQGISYKTAEESVEGLVKGLQLPLLLQVREAKWRGVRSVEQLIDLLQENRDDWTVDSFGQIIFDVDAAQLADKYNRLVGEIQTAFERVESLTNQMIKNSAQMLREP